MGRRPGSKNKPKTGIINNFKDAHILIEKQKQKVRAKKVQLVIEESETLLPEKKKVVREKPIPVVEDKIEVAQEKEITIETGRRFFKEIPNKEAYAKIFHGTEKSAILIYANKEGIYVNGYYTRPFCHPITNRFANLVTWEFISWTKLALLKAEAAIIGEGDEF